MPSYRVYLITDEETTFPLLWDHPSTPSIGAYPGGRVQLVGAFETRDEAWEAFKSLVRRDARGDARRGLDA